MTSEVDASPFKQRLMKMLEAEGKRRGGRFTRESFATSVGLKPQSISSMRQAISMDSLAEAMRVYPHWNFRYLVAGEGEPIPEEPSPDETLKVAEAEIDYLKKDRRDLILENAKFQEECAKLRRENDILNQKVTDLLRTIQILEQQRAEDIPGVRKGGLKAG